MQTTSITSNDPMRFFNAEVISTFEWYNGAGQSIIRQVHDPELRIVCFAKYLTHLFIRETRNIEWYETIGRNPDTDYGAFGNSSWAAALYMSNQATEMRDDVVDYIKHRLAGGFWEIVELIRNTRDTTIISFDSQNEMSVP